jgi:capsular polysaccharide biosynthesis protein
MELKDYLRILSKHKVMIWSLAILVTAAVLIYDVRQPIEYHGSLTLMVINKTEEVDDYRYDHYYSVEAASILAKSIESWFRSPDNIVRIYQESGVVLPTDDMKKLQNLFNRQRYNPDSSLLVIQLTGFNQADLQKVLEKSGQKVKDKLRNLQERQILGDNFYLDVEGPTILAQQKDYLFDAVLAFVLGIILGGILAFVKEYLKD